MDKVARHQQARGERVRDFADTHTALFASGDAAEDIAIVRAEITNLSNSGGSQSGSGQAAKGDTARIAEIVHETEAELRDIARTGRRLKKRDPNMTAHFELPANDADDTIMNTARGFITNATPLKAKFIARGMADDFLDDLGDLVEEYDDLVAAQTGHEEDRGDDTAAITASVKNLVDAIDDLDDIMKNKLKMLPAELGEWKRASARGKIPRNPKKTP